MAFSLFSTILFLVSMLAVSGSQHQLHQQYHADASHGGGLKSLEFTVYLHETFNKTGYFIVKGVAGPSAITKTFNPFGSLFVYSDPVTETPDPSSRLLGYAEGSAITSSFDGERTTCVIGFSLNFKGYKGEILTVGTGYTTQVCELPLIGGTGSFRFVQGYLISTLVDLSGPGTCYKIEFHLFWPPYAAV